MKKILLAIALLFPLAASAQEQFPWILTVYGGGASLCDEVGCFGPSGPAFGASFGRAMGSRWSFELEGTAAFTTETGLPRVDLPTGIIFTPELERTRIWGGGHFLARVAGAEDSMNFFISIGVVGGYEQQKEVVPEGVFATPTRDIGIKGGVAGGAGMNIWLSDSWGIRPEVRFYLVAEPLSGVRYTAGLMKKF